MNKKGALSEAAWINPPAKLPISSKPTDEVAFIPMASVSETGCLQNVETRLLGSCLKGYTVFQKGDVLVAKITPCMENGKATVVENILSPIGFGSTEFHVIRPKPNFDSLYLFHAVWNQTFRLEAGKNMTGSAGQKRVPKSFLERFEIPLPPLEEQQRIADILDKADAICRKRQQALRLADEFLRSVFLEMFGNPESNPYTWPVKKLGFGVAEFQGGRNMMPTNTSRTDGLRVLKVSAVTSGEYKSYESKSFEQSEIIPDDFLVSADDLLISRANPNKSPKKDLKLLKLFL